LDGHDKPAESTALPLPNRATIAAAPMNRVVAVAVALVSVAFVVFDAFFLDFFGIFIILPAALLPLGIVGALLIARVPRNAVGWLLALAGILLELLLAASAYDWAALVRDPGSLPYGEIAVVLANRLFPPAIGCTVLMLLFFPSGQGLGGRWTWIERAIALLVVAIGVIDLFRDAPLQLSMPLTLLNPDTGSIPNPLALHGPAAAIISAVAFIAGSWTIPTVLVGPLSLFVRYRRSSELERAQIRWLAYAGTIALALIVASNFASGALSNGLWAGGIVALGFLPIAIALAIFHYRLYDIDLLINRTIVYGATTAAIATTFWVGILALQRLLSPVTSGSEPAIAASTLVSLALFQPVRRRMQEAVDRRFDRSRYDAARTVDAFADQLRDEVDLDALRTELLGAVSRTMAPAHASLWLRAPTL